MDSDLSNLFSRHLDGTINIGASLRRVEDAVKQRIALEKTIGEVLVDALKDYKNDHRIWLPDLISLVLRHHKMKDCENSLAVPDIIRHHIAYTPSYTIVKGRMGGV